VLLIVILFQLTAQVMGPPPIRHLVLVRDVPLPSVLPTQFIPDLRNIPSHQGPLDPGVTVRFDHFDFQAIDPNTHLLFINHSGPAPDKYVIADPKFNPDKNSQVDGYVAIFDTIHNKLVGRVNVPQTAGMVVAPDLGRVYTADSNDNIMYSIDEHTLKATPIPLGDNEGPDAVAYDQDDHKIFVSDPGVPNPDNVDLKNQNLTVIDALTNKVTKINLGHLPKLPNEHADLMKFGYDVGHNHYDPGLRREFVTIQQLTDQSSVNPSLPPPGTGELVSVNPVTEQVVDRVQLPTTCGTPHGMTIDTQQHIAFIACTDVDPNSHLVQNLVRVDLQTMKVIPDPLQVLAVKPDMVVLDNPAHILFVGCNGGISVFDVQNRTLKKLGDYIFGKGTHSITVDESTQLVYIPLVDVGGRPTLRILKFIPNGV
jgi:DNA-binding beta-propeller fold protein YncE